MKVQKSSVHFLQNVSLWKEFLDIRSMWEKNLVDSTTIPLLPNMTSHVLYFSANNKVIVRIGKQAFVGRQKGENVL